MPDSQDVVDRLFDDKETLRLQSETILKKDKEIGRLDAALRTACDKTEALEERLYTLEKERDLLTVSNVALRDDIVRLESQLVEKEEPKPPHRNLQTLLEFCKNENAGMKAEISALKTELEKEKDHSNSLECQITELDTELDKTRDEVAYWSEYSYALDKELGELKKGTETLMYSSEEIQDQALQIATEFEKVKKKHEELVVKFEEYKSAHAFALKTIENKDVYITTLLNTIEEYRKIIANLNNKEGRDQLVETCRDLQNRVGELCVDAQYLRTKIYTLENKNRRLADDNKYLKDEWRKAYIGGRPDA